MLNFLNSPFFTGFFTGFSTIIVGLVALYVYKLQQWSSKKDAANIVFQEIVYAEGVIKDIKETRKRSGGLVGDLDTNKLLIRSSSWEKYKYLFVNDFDSNEWDRLNIFFDQCGACDTAIKEIGGLLPMNLHDRILVIQEALSDLSLRYSQEFYDIGRLFDMQRKAHPESYNPVEYNAMVDTLTVKYKELKEAYLSKFVDDAEYIFLYAPVKDYKFLEKMLETIDTSISVSTIGNKIKKIAKLK